MTKVTIISGFLGAGKTTLIKKLIKEAYTGEKLVLIENEFGQIGVDGGFLKDAGIEITEMNSGCICCSLVGDFGEALTKVITDYAPDRILIEPSGVGKLSDVISAVERLNNPEISLDGFTTVVDAKKCRMYQKNFGEFFDNQIENASGIILSHTGGLSQEKIDGAVELLRRLNPDAPLVTTDWDQLDGKQIVESMTRRNTLEGELKEMLEHEHEHHHHDHDEEHECCHGHHHHDHDDEEHECCHGHHHHDHDDEHECCHGHHHHDHDDEEHECCHGHHHDHEHEHHHDGECCCHDHDHHHHHADEVFTSWGRETSRPYSAEAIEAALAALADEETYGIILRAKGIVPAEDGRWIHFDYVPGTPDVRFGSAETTGRLCVIGSKLNESAVAKLFCVE